MSGTTAIQTLRWRWREDAARGLPLWVAPFPQQWHDVLAPLAGKKSLGTQGDRGQGWLPTRALRDALAVLFPQIVSIDDAAEHPRESARRRGWLFAESALDGGDLSRVVRSWVLTSNSNGLTRTQLLPLAERAIEAGPQWEPITAYRARQDDAGAGVDFLLVPYLLARRTVECEAFHTGNTALRFLPVRDPGRGVRLVSWVPEGNPERGTAYSVGLRWHLETAPAIPHPEREVLLSVGVRRWIGHAKDNGFIRLDLAQRHAVYLRHAKPLLPRTAPAQALVRALIRFQGRTPCWEPGVIDIISFLELSGTALPLPDDLLDRSAAWLRGIGDTTAVITYHTADPGSPHRVRPGATPPDRRALWEQVCDRFSDLLEPAAASVRLQRESRQVYRLCPLFDPFSPKVTAEQRADAFKHSVGDRGAILVLWQTEQGRDALVAALHDSYGLPLLPSIQILTAPAGPLAGAASDARQRSTEAAHYATDEAAGLPPLGTVMELANTRGTPGDPKQALRAGLATAGFVSQFLEPWEHNGEDKTKCTQRVLHAAYDLGRAMGYILTAPCPPFAARSPLFREGAPSLLGLLTVPVPHRSTGDGFEPGSRNHRRMPVLVRLRRGSMLAEIISPASGDWLRYRDAALKWADQDLAAFIPGTADLQRKRWDAWLQAQLSDIHEPTLLIGDAMSSRSWCQWLANNQIERLRGYVSPEARRNLRIVRLRHGDETPEWFVAAASRYTRSGEHGLTSGLFPSGSPNRWFSIQRRADNLRRVLLGEHRTAKPTASTWIPQAMELYAMGFPDGEDPSEAVAYVHHLRAMHSHHDSPTVLPLPLHLGAKLFSDLPDGLAVDEF